MATEQVITMVLSVDLQCRQCHKKVEKILAKFRRESPNKLKIRYTLYDEEQKTVTIKMVCSSPEGIRRKLCNEGGKSISSIEIIKDNDDPPKPKRRPSLSSHPAAPVQLPPNHSPSPPQPPPPQQLQPIFQPPPPPPPLQQQYRPIWPQVPYEEFYSGYAGWPWLPRSDKTYSYYYGVCGQGGLWWDCRP